MRATGMHEYLSEHHAANMKGEEIVLNKAYNIMSDYTPGKDMLFAVENSVSCRDISSYIPDCGCDVAGSISGVLYVLALQEP